MSTAPPEEHRITGTVLDHIAHAVPRWQDAWDRYAVALGAEWASGGPGPGFAPGQVRFANGARVEMLMPWDVEVNDFLVRFLATHGPGAHHMTFKVPDLAGALERVRSYGIEPIGVDMTHPEWMEAFLHPKLATGVVIQLAQALDEWDGPAPADYPSERRTLADGSGPAPASALVRVCHVVADLDGAVDLFSGVLDGRRVADGTSPGIRWVDLAWPGPLGVRLLGPDGTGGPLDDWLGGLVGRVHHVALEVTEPDSVPGAAPATSAIALAEAPEGTPVWEIGPDVNLGLRLVLVPAPA